MPSCKACVGTHSAVLQIHPPVKIVPRLPHSRANRSAFNGEAERQRFIAFDQRRADRSSDQRQVGYIKKTATGVLPFGGSGEVSRSCSSRHDSYNDKFFWLVEWCFTSTQNSYRDATLHLLWYLWFLHRHFNTLAVVSLVLTQTLHYTCCSISGSYTDATLHYTCCNISGSYRDATQHLLWYLWFLQRRYTTLAVVSATLHLL